MVLFLVEQTRQAGRTEHAKHVRLEALVEKEDDCFRKRLEKRIVEELKKFEKTGGKNGKADKAVFKELEKFRARDRQSTNYDFGLESAYFDKGSSTKTKNAYYELGAESRENSAKAGNSYESYTGKHESAVLKQGQKLQQEAKACHQQHKIHITLDCKEKEARDSIKLFSPATWQLMYDVNGKIDFN